MFFVVRHGERADDMLLMKSEVSFNPVDPPITLKGEQQSIITGRKLKSIIDMTSDHNKEIIFLSSPFQRCIQTCQGIQLGMEMNSEIYIQKELGEILKSSFFSSNPLPKLEIYKNSPSTYPTYFKNQTSIEYPEQCAQVEIRIQKLINEIVKEMGNKIFILVTHARPLKTILHSAKLDQVEKIPIQYCHTLTISLDKNGTIQSVPCSNSIN